MRTIQVVDSSWRPQKESDTEIDLNLTTIEHGMRMRIFMSERLIDRLEIKRILKSLDEKQISIFI